MSLGPFFGQFFQKVGKESSIKIAFGLNHYPWKPIGGVRVTYEYANHLAARGHEVLEEIKIGRLS